MLSYDDALARILGTVAGPLEAELVPLHAAVGRALSVDVFAGIDLPPFANSAVDGFAVRLANVSGATAENPVILPVTRTIAAGNAPGEPLKPGVVARILTGAPVPEGADAIVMVEDTRPAAATADGECIAFLDHGSAGSIRRAGSDVKAGVKAVNAGTTIDAGIVGLLAALNCANVSCSRRPRVGLIVTGDEIVPVGTNLLTPGKIYNSNGPALVAAIEEAGGDATVIRHAADSEESTRQALADCAASCDLIVSTGGVSVGEHDYVKSTVESMGTLDFWRIAIKPGKPLAFGKVGDALFFGLPGNPVSSLVTFELFVRPVLRKLGGHGQVTRLVASATLSANLPHEPGRREFVRASLKWEDDGFVAAPTGLQGSHRLSSLIGAECFLVADENRGDYAAGERLPTMLLTV